MRNGVRSSELETERRTREYREDRESERKREEGRKREGWRRSLKVR